MRTSPPPPFGCLVNERKEGSHFHGHRSTTGIVVRKGTRVQGIYYRSRETSNKELLKRNIMNAAVKLGSACETAVTDKKHNSCNIME